MGSVIMCEVFKIRSVSAEIGERGDWEVSGWCVHRGSTDYDDLVLGASRCWDILLCCVLARWPLLM